MAKKKLTDLTGDGKITRKDFLRGAGVPGFKDGKLVRVPMEPDDETLDRIEQERRESGILFSQTAQDIEDIMAGEKSGPTVKKKKLERRGDDKPVKKFGQGGDVCVGGGADRTQGARSAIRGTKYSGTY